MLLSLSGCATTANNYCDIAKPIYFGSDATVDYLADNDAKLLRDVVTHNETTESLCND